MKAVVVVTLLVMMAPDSPLAGLWSFDPYLSDHPEQIARVLRLSSGQLSPADVPVEAIARGEYARPDQQRYHEPLREPDQRAFDELTTAVQYPPRRLSIAQSVEAIAIDSGQVAPAVLATDGKPEKHALGAGTIERRARWEGPHLVVSYALEHGGTLAYRYTIAPTTGQLVIRVTFERRSGVPAPFEIKLIYNRDTARP